MTIRDNLQYTTSAKYPGTNVQTIANFRCSLGIGIPAPTSSHDGDDVQATTTDRPKLLLLGHDMDSNLTRLHGENVRLDYCFNYTGIVDTHVIIDDTGIHDLPRGLSTLMDRYQFAEMTSMKPKRGKKKIVFDGAHNAGNDAVATLKVALAQALDPDIGEIAGYDTLEEGWQDQRLSNIDIKLVLLAFDGESTETDRYKAHVTNRTTELGFAALVLKDVVGVAPGDRGVNWHPYIQARHWINNDFRNFRNKEYVVGDPNDFRHGRSEYYWTKQNPRPIHAFFERLASGAKGITSEKTREEKETGRGGKKKAAEKRGKKKLVGT